jgi:hypothetical protein
MNGIERTITIEPGGPMTFDPITVEGNPPPFGLPSWWPWAVAAIAIGGLWYLTREEGHRRPLAGAG